MRCLRFVLILALVVGLFGSWAVCQTNDPDVSIYKGEDPNQNGMTLGAWGSGSAIKTNEQILDGAWSIKMTTQSLYSGAKIDFSQPVTLYSGGIKNDRYIQFTMYFKDIKVVNPAAGYEYAMADVDPYTMPKANKVRFVFIADSGETVEAVEPTCALDTDDNWMRVAVPLAKFKAKEGAPVFRMKSLLIFTDIPSTFYLSSAKLTTDDAPIKVAPLDSRTIQIMDPQFFVADCAGGVSSLKYAWDFDATNGVQVDSSDKTAKYIYTKGGEYTVTLTVSDADGLKEPTTVTTVIEVTD